MKVEHRQQSSEIGCFFECSTKYLTINDEGKLVRKSGVILVRSDDFKSAEDLSLSQLKNISMEGEGEIVSIKRARYEELIYSDNADSKKSSIPEGCTPFYVSFQIEIVNPDTGRVSKNKQTTLVVAKDIPDAKSTIDRVYNTYDYTILSVSVSHIIDIILP